MHRQTQIKILKQKSQLQTPRDIITDNKNESTPRKRFPTIAGQLTVPQSNQSKYPGNNIENRLLKQLNIQQVSQDHSHRSFQQQSKSIIQPLYSPKNDPNLYTVEQIEIHKKMIQNMWDYRYWRLVNYAIKTKDWMPVFAFLGQFKLKCVQIIKKLIACKFQYKEIDRIDHRYELKGQNQIGIYLIDGIIIRVTKLSKNKKQFDKRAQKNLHQQYISYNIVNDLIISLCTQMPNFPTLRVPVTSLVKYMGYTCLCQGDTMCNGIQTLIYGPMSSTFKYQQNITQLLHTIGRNLNLKSFNVMTANKSILQIPFCLTVQLHKVNIAFRDMSIISWFNPQSRIYPNHQKQNKLLKPQYYLLSFAKLWPLFIDSNIVSSSGYLRPQAVLAWKKELSNAVFTNIAFQKDQLGQLQLAQACKSVKQQCIKQLANFLDQASFFVVDSVGIQEIMHYYKINMKFLGQVANKFTLDSNRKVFQIQMTARILKKLFYTNIQGLQKYNIKQLAADFFNLVFLVTQQSETFYTKVVYPHIQKYYDYKIAEYPPNFSGGGLMHALCFHLGLKIKVMDYPLFKNMQSFFAVVHILDFVPHIRTFNMDTCELKKACEKFKQKKKQGKQSSMTQCINQLKLLAAISKISSPQGTYSISSSPQSYFYAQLAQVYRSLNDYEQCYKYADLSIKGIPDKHADSIKAYCTFIRYHGWKKQINKCYQYYEKALANITYHLHQNHPLSISVHNTLGFQLLNSNADSSKCQKTFQKSFEVCQQALGYMHSTSGKILLQLADLPLPPEKVIHFLLQALTILQNIQTDKEKVRNVCKKISQMYAKMNNLTKMIQFARKSQHWTNQIIALQKLNEYKMVLQLCSRPANSVQQLQFLIQKSFSSYIKLLDSTSSFNLQKIFVVLADHLPRNQTAAQRIYKKLTTQFSISMTIVQFVKTSLNNLLAQIPQVLKQKDYRVGPYFLLQYKDRKLKVWIENYMDILAIVGKEKSQSIFTQFRKRF